MNTKLTLAIIELILIYGPEAAINLIRGSSKPPITPAAIQALKVSPPEHFFGDNSDG